MPFLTSRWVVLWIKAWAPLPAGQGSWGRAGDTGHTPWWSAFRAGGTPPEGTANAQD
ncbi:hypothetical protein GCM10009679_40760 [Saccharothrix algeriensis]|uniref:Uncharacterized protein n=1 Tax=Catellatospora bangladeshensis TaxID=310355 RepID=A0A8J3NMS2_9ACTN|nr:hypothetical protein Cba03nite_54290 [Catellatospora bangladeshensis]